MNSSAHLTRATAETAGGRCSISSGTELDYRHLQISELSTGFVAIAGTRGFTVSAGVPFTASLVCDQYLGDVRLQDSSMTTIFSRAAS